MCNCGRRLEEQEEVVERGFGWGIAQPAGIGQMHPGWVTSAEEGSQQPKRPRRCPSLDMTTSAKIVPLGTLHCGSHTAHSTSALHRHSLACGLIVVKGRDSQPQAWPPRVPAHTRG